MVRIRLAVAVSAFTMGCAANVPPAAECRDLACLEAYDPASDGKFDDAGNDVYDAVSARLQTQYGVRPRRYNGFFNESNLGERRFRAALPQVTAFVNERLTSRGRAPALDDVGIAINFITEGGYYALDITGLQRELAMTDPEAAAMLPTWERAEAEGLELLLDGFTFFGVDTLVDNFEAVRPYMPADIQALVDGGMCIATRTNERGQAVRSLDCLTIEQGMYANAGMFAWYREQAAQAIGASVFAALPEVGRFFWTTVFFNSGSGTAQRLLRDNGVGYYSVYWSRGDDHLQWGTSPKFNATWRSASYEFMRDTVFAPDDLPGEGVCRWEDMYDFGGTRPEATLLDSIVDVGGQTLRGYFPGTDLSDWIRVDVSETSYTLGMCAQATLRHLPEDYTLCAYYERSSDPVEGCSMLPGTADETVALDLDRFARDDSGQLFVEVRRGAAPPAVCDGYELTWTVSVGSCH